VLYLFLVLVLYLWCNSCVVFAVLYLHCNTSVVYLLYNSFYTVYTLPIPTVVARDDEVCNQNPYQFFMFILLNMDLFNSIFTLTLKLLQNRGKSSDLTPWKSVSKQVGKFTPNRVTETNKTTFLERNWHLRRYITLEIKTVGFYFISKFNSKLSLYRIQLRACRPARSCCCSVSADRQVRATTSPAYEWSGSVYLKLCRSPVSLLCFVATVCLSLSE